jgi:hypothetical protein
VKATNQGKKQLCKELYYKYRTLDEIVSETGINKLTLRCWVHGRTKNDRTSWRNERDDERSKVLKENFARRNFKIESITDLSIDFIKFSLDTRLNSRDRAGKKIPFSFKESKAAMDIALGLDKLKRLEEGSPTDILGIKASVEVTHVRACTAIELRNAILKDPFMSGLITDGEIKDDRPDEDKTDELRDEDAVWEAVLESGGAESTPRGDHGASQGPDEQPFSGASDTVFEDIDLDD